MFLQLVLTYQVMSFNQGSIDAENTLTDDNPLNVQVDHNPDGKKEL